MQVVEITQFIIIIIIIIIILRSTILFTFPSKVFTLHTILYAASYMLLQSSAYNLLLLCLLSFYVYVYLRFVGKFLHLSY